ncbi:MAG TPA: tetratricopeptide repeat protein [Thermoanaerobaculia bacterium]|nr:tetratricopeptide repeat protein [Thermoanaerobaculia bacterium]
MRTPALHLLICAALVVMTAIVFAQVRNHELLSYDDPIYITSNEQVKKGLTADGVAWAFRSFDFNWHPLTWISHMIDVELFGVDAGRHLLMNAALHAVNAILVFLLLLQMTSLPWRSAIVAAVFAIHPLHVESVAWLSERKDVLSALFFFLTLMLYVSFTRTRSRVAYGAMVFTFILALLSKGMPVTLPFVLLLLDWWPLRRMERLRWQNIWPLVREKLPLFAIVIAASLVTFRSQQELASLATTDKLSPAIRIANAVLSYGRYLAKAIWPSNLVVPYEYSSVSTVKTAIAAVVLLAITALVLRYRDRRYLATGWFWFLGILVPVIGLVQIGAYSMADRYTYVPLIGVTIAVVWLLADFVARRPALRAAAAVVTTMVLVLLTAAAHRQTGYWRNTIALFSHTLSVEPRNPFASLSLGDALLQTGQPAEAARHFRVAAQMWPSNSIAHLGLGMSLARMGQTTEAAPSLQRAVQLNPNSETALVELGRLQLSTGQTEEAAATLTQAATVAGPGTALSLGTLAVARNDLQGALVHFQRAVEADPASSEARNNLGATLAKLGRDHEAVAQYEEALRVTPEHYDGHMNLGALLSRMERNADAARHFNTAARLRPRSAEPLIYAALALANENRNEEAADLIKKAIALDPVEANAQFSKAVRRPDLNLDIYLAALEAQ